MADEDQVAQQELYNELLKQSLQLETQKTSILQSQFEIMNSMFGVGTQNVDSQTDSVTNLEDAMASLNKEQQKANKSFEQQDDELKDVFGSTSKLTLAVTKLGSSLNKIIPLSVGVMTLAKTFKALSVAAGGAMSIFTTLAGSVIRMGLALFTLPLGIIDDLFGEAQKFGSNELRRQLEETRKVFGDLGKFESKAIVSGFRSIKGAVAETGLSSYRIFGNMAERLQFVRESAINMGVAFSLLQNQVAMNAERLGAYTKGLGLNEAGQKALANRAVATGQSLTEIGRQITTFAFQVGNSFGINGKLISRDVGEMMGDIEHFGNQSIQTLTNVAVYARRLGVDVKALTKVIDSFDNFDKAAESVARLSQAFGLQLDTFSLVQEQDPAARIEQLRKAFFAACKSIESMTRQERSLLATQTGLDQETLALVFSQKSQGKSYEDIQKKSEQARKQQLTQAEAMQKLANSIERLVKDGQSLQGGLFDILFSGFAAGIRRSGPFREMMRDIRHLMRELFRVGREMGKMFVDMFPGIKQLFGGLGNFLSPQGIGRNFQKLKDQFKTFLTGLTPENAGAKINAFIKSVSKNFSEVLSGPGVSQIKSAVMTIASVVSNLFAGILTNVIEGLTSLTTGLTKALANPSGIIAGLTQGAQKVEGGLASAFAPLVDAFMKAAPALGDALLGLMKQVLTMAFDGLKSFVGTYWKEIALVLFGPAVISSALSAVASAAAGALVKGIGGVLAKSAVGIAGGGGGSGAVGSAIAKSIGGADKAAEAISKSKALTNISPATIAKAVAAIAVIGGALALGMYALVKAFAGVSPAQIGVASLAMVAAAGVATVVGLAVVGLGALGAALSGPQALLIAAGVAGIAIIGGALAVGMLALIKAFAGVTEASVTKVGSIMTTALMVVGEIAASALILTGVGILGTIAPVVAAGMLGLALIAKGLGATFGSVIKSLNSIDIGSLILVNVKLNAILDAIKGIVLIGGFIATATLGLAAAAVPIMLAAKGSELLFSGIKTISDQMVNSVSGLLRNIGALPGGNEIQAKVGIFTSVVQAVVGFGSTVKDMLDVGGTFDGIGNTAKSINSVMRMMTGEVVSMVTDFISAANGIQGVEVIAPKLEVITGILGSVSNFAKSITSTGVTDEDAIEALQGFSSAVFRSLNSFIQSSLPQLTQLISTISTSSLGSVNVDAVKAFGEIINTVLTGFGNILVRLANTLTREGTLISDADSLAAVAPNLGRAIGSMVKGLTGDGNGGLFGAVTMFVEGIAGVAANINVADIQKIKVIGDLMGPLFGAISSISNAAATLGGAAVGGNADAFSKLQNVIGAITGGITGSLSKLINGLIETFGSLDKKSITAIKAASPILTNLFEGIKGITNTIDSFGNTAGGNEAGGKAQNAFQNIYQAIFGDAGESSLYGFIRSLNSGAAAALVSAIDSGQGIFAILSQKIGQFKGNLTSVLGVVDTGFLTGLDGGLKSTLSHVDETIGNIIETINDVHKKINSLGSSININAALRNLGDAIGTANPERLQIARGDITINITVNVKMDVDDIEEAIATRNGGSTFIVNKNAAANGRPYLQGVTPSQ